MRLTAKNAEAQIEAEQLRRDARLLDIQEKEKQERLDKESKNKDQRAGRFQTNIARHVLTYRHASRKARDATATAALEAACATEQVRSRGRRNAAFFHFPQFWCGDSDLESLGR